MKKVEVNKELFLELVKQRFSAKEIAKRLNMKYGTVRKRCAEWGVRVNPIRKHSEETKKKLSSAKKLWCSKNPEKHNWRKHDKFKSVPCEKLKDWLKSKGIQYVEEFMPLFEKGRYYSIDIAFPDKKIGIEINGNQHYENDGSLKKYYKERHDIIEAEGWKLYELHYSECFKSERIEIILPTILASEIKQCFDYKILRRQKKIYSCECGASISDTSKKCSKCHSESTRKVTWPSKEELQKLIWERPTSQLAKDFGVSDVAISKWCKFYDLSKPARGYWMKNGGNDGTRTHTKTT